MSNEFYVRNKPQTSFNIATSLLHGFALQSFGNARQPHTSLIDAQTGIYGLRRTAGGGYFLSLASGGTIFRSYTHPCRAMNVSRLAYDVKKLQRAHQGETGLSQVSKV